MKELQNIEGNIISLAGKTTFCEAVLAIERSCVYSGEILFDFGTGHDAGGKSLRDLGGLVGFLPQDSGWMALDLTPRSLLTACVTLHAAQKRKMLWRREAGVVALDGPPHRRRESSCAGAPPSSPPIDDGSFAGDDATPEVASILSDLGLSLSSGVLDRPIRSLSGGERTRVAIGFALLARPRLLVLDEPTSGLDDVTGDEVLLLLRSLSRRQHKLCIVLTIHRPEEDILHLFDGIFHLQNDNAGAHLLSGAECASRMAEHRRNSQASSICSRSLLGNKNEEQEDKGGEEDEDHTNRRAEPAPKVKLDEISSPSRSSIDDPSPQTAAQSRSESDLRLIVGLRSTVGRVFGSNCPASTITTTQVKRSASDDEFAGQHARGCPAAPPKVVITKNTTTAPIEVEPSTENIRADMKKSTCGAPLPPQTSFFLSRSEVISNTVISNTTTLFFSPFLSFRTLGVEMYVVWGLWCKSYIASGALCSNLVSGLLLIVVMALLVVQAEWQVADMHVMIFAVRMAAGSAAGGTSACADLSSIRICVCCCEKDRQESSAGSRHDVSKFIHGMILIKKVLSSKGISVAFFDRLRGLGLPAVAVPRVRYRSSTPVSPLRLHAPKPRRAPLLRAVGYCLGIAEFHERRETRI